ncbi:hypothetical protein [Streptomyces sp. DASNCL29]|uniref:hypothetical protein n=1 Tax=Streptomyces sp. DASNCL29 TaxID=2583819 RepID=UPI00110F7C03|nr:hypothetical protein [Streptomyces sp. DASNCL29]TMU98054.1 hypothetical protein FGK60_09465 [Streptomyces sp. DASNCL29]
MSIDLNERPPAADETQRRGHMAALAVAEHIVAISPIVPNDVKVTCDPFAPGAPRVNVYFHNSREGVEALAEALGGTASTRPHSEGDPRPFVSASVVVSSVPVRVWSLLDGVADEASAVAA